MAGRSRLDQALERQQLHSLGGSWACRDGSGSESLKEFSVVSFVRLLPYPNTLDFWGTVYRLGQGIRGMYHAGRYAIPAQCTDTTHVQLISI